MPSVLISDHTLQRLNQAAAMRGLDVNLYADELLALSLATLLARPAMSEKQFRIMDFAGVAPTGRSSSEIDAEIEADHAAWDNVSEEIPSA